MSVAELRTSVPERERRQMGLAICLTMTAGYLDGYGLLVLGTYVSFMSGNTTAAGVKIGQGNLLAALSPAIAILSFLVGSFIANLITQSPSRYTYGVLSGLTTVLLVISFVIGYDGTFKTISIALLSLGMGMVNPALSQVGAESVSMTFMTGTLNRIGSHLAAAFKGSQLPASGGPWDTHLYRAGLDAGLWVSFIVGAIASGILMSFMGAFALLPAIAVMVVLFLVSMASSLRGNLSQAHAR